MEVDEREENRTNMKIDTLAINTQKGRSISFNSVDSATITPYLRTNEERSFEKRRWKEQNMDFLKKEKEIRKRKEKQAEKKREKQETRS